MHSIERNVTTTVTLFSSMVWVKQRKRVRETVNCVNGIGSMDYMEFKIGLFNMHVAKLLKRCFYRCKSFETLHFQRNRGIEKNEESECQTRIGKRRRERERERHREVVVLAKNSHFVNMCWCELFISLFLPIFREPHENGRSLIEFG